MKRCSKCREHKSPPEFYRSKRFADELTAWCKACFAAAKRTPTARAREAAGALRYYYEHRTKRLAAAKVYRATPEGRVKRAAYGSAIPPARKLYQHAKSRAKRSGIPFDIAETDVVIPDRCPLLGIALARGTAKWWARSPSLDRIDPTKGYVRGNVWVISYRANRLKMDASLEELEALVSNLRARLRPIAA